MNIHAYCLLAFGLLGTHSAWSEPPFVLVQTIEMPEVPSGPYIDHMAIDFKGRRLFTTPQANKAIDVVDLAAGKVQRTIPGFGNPHAILYRHDRNRLFVTDGDGALHVLDSNTYARIKSIKLERDADGIAYDAKTGYLYVSNGGAAAGKDYSLISIVDTAREAKIGDIRISAPGLEAMVIDNSSDRLYVNLPELNTQARTGEREWRVDSADPIALGGAHVDQIALVHLKIHANFRVFDRLALLAGCETGSAGERARLKNSVFVRVSRNAGAGRDAPLRGDPI